MECVMKSCKKIASNGECTDTTRAKAGGYNCKFNNCECYVQQDKIKHTGFKLSLVGDDTATLELNSKKFDLLTCYKLSEAFKTKGGRFSPAMIFEEITEDRGK